MIKCPPALFESMPSSSILPLACCVPELAPPDFIRPKGRHLLTPSEPAGLIGCYPFLIIKSECEEHAHKEEVTRQPAAVRKHSTLPDVDISARALA